MLGWRVGISVVLVPALVGLFLLDHRTGATAPYLLAFCLAVGVRAVWELCALLDVRASRPSFVMTACCTAGVIASGWAGHLFDVPGLSDLRPLEVIAVTVSLAMLALFLRSAAIFHEPGHSIDTLGAELLATIYIGMLLAVTAQLRWVAEPEAGYLVLGSLLIATKCGDIGAYFLGRFFGKRKLIPRLSPGKTRMGAVGAFVGSGLGAWAWLTWATPLFNPEWQPPVWYWCVLYGVILGLIGLIGDLCESLLKRDCNKKDSSTLLPGFGGILDLIDSVLYAGPVAYLLWRLLPLATWMTSTN
ncbi:phosphatidate cytidylyltransferase [Thalassoroseus pseudoceratinae]|uniref:phosphatidate cytidylyltransferase n=1 Tax=Thalassoroseus pseudoceratinae TaxID=2713176 RepID=UPI001423FC49|nr:phosphatidate cytidylyltransferase [Thalassoroseus pseudoceratinae]